MQFVVDVTKVCDFLGIEVEGFNHLTISQIEEAKAGIEKYELDVRRNDEKIMDDYRFFFKSYDFFVNLFGKELTDKCLPTIRLSDIVTKKEIRRGQPHYSGKARLIEQRNGYLPVLRGPGSRSGRKEFVPVDVYEVSSEYQGLTHSKIIRAIFEEKYPGLNNFKLSIYEIVDYKGTNEFYVSTETNTSLYVPFEAFVKGDVDAIIERNVSYLTWQGKDNKDTVQTLLDCETVQLFLSYVETLKLS